MQLIVVSGLPGTGKSSIADAIGRALGIPVFAKDWLEATLLRCGLQRDGADYNPIGYAGYELLTVLAVRQLSLGQSTILDSVAGFERIRAQWRKAATEQRAAWRVIECVCSDEALHRAGLARRRRRIPGWHELAWSEVERVRAYYEPWQEERLILDAVNPFAENVRAALVCLGHRQPRGLQEGRDRMNSWEKALVTVADLVPRDAEGYQIPWVVVGSAASALHGCRFTPNDLDILVPSMDDLRRFVALLAPHARALADPPIVSESFPFGFEWHKARWDVGGFDTEIVYIASGGGIPDSTGGDGIWEGGRLIWSLVEMVELRGRSIPVVPLEVQLESQLRRGRQDRAEEIQSLLRARGYDPEFLQQALSTQHFSDFHTGS